MQHVKLIKALSFAFLLSCGMQMYAMDNTKSIKLSATHKMKAIMAKDDATMIKQAQINGLDEESIGKLLAIRHGCREKKEASNQPKSIFNQEEEDAIIKWFDGEVKSEKEAQTASQAVAPAVSAASAPQAVALGKSTKEKMAELQEKKARRAAEKAAKDAVAQQEEMVQEAEAVVFQVVEPVQQKSDDQKLTPLQMLRMAARKDKEKKLKEAQEGNQKKAEEVVLILADDELQEPEPVQQESENPRLQALREKRDAAIAAQAPESAQQETTNPKLIALREERKKHLSHMDRELQKYGKKKNKIDAEKETDQKPAEEVAVTPAAPVVRKNKRLEALMAVAESQTLPEVLELGAEIESAIEQQESAAQADKININEVGKLERSVQEMENQYPHLFKRAGATAQAMARLIDQAKVEESDAAVQEPVVVAPQEERDTQGTGPAIESQSGKKPLSARMLALREQQAVLEGISEEPRKLGRYQQAKEAAAAQAKEAAAAREAKLARPLVGPEVEAVYTTDEYKLIEGGWILRTDASLPYKNESMLFDNLASDNQDYLCNARATRHLNCMINHVSAGIVQTLRAHGILDIETKKRIFTIDGINAILALQDPRTEKISNLFNLLAVRIAEGKKPRLQPDEGAMRFLQTSVKAISQLQLLKVRMQTLQDNPRIRETKALDRLVHSMRLAPDKGEISDEEDYTDDNICLRIKKAVQ